MECMIVVLLLVALIVPSPAQAVAAPITFAADLRGANEIPPTASAGTGHATVVLDPVANTMSVNVTFSGLSGSTTASHIHCCSAQPSNAGVATTVPTFPGFPLGVSAGTYSHAFNLLDSTTYNPAFVTAQGGTIGGAEAALVNGIEAGQSYLNIHSNVSPGGEIRGILAAVPEPATLLLLTTGLAGLGRISLRRHQRYYPRRV